MRIVSEKLKADGTRRITLELPKEEKLLAVNSSMYYRLGYPLDDEVVQGFQLEEMEAVYWCVVAQKWQA